MTDFTAPTSAIATATSGQKKALTQILFSFEGRLSRKPFWLMGFLLPYVAFLVAMGILSTLMAGSMSMVAMGAMGIAYIVFVWIMLAAQTKRLHDVNKSGWYQLMSLVPLVGPILVLIKLCERGTPGENQYGPDETDLY